jgi:ABC-2 type transport system permease protein
VSGALRYEWARITTIRSTWWLTGMALLVSFGFSLLIGYGFKSSPDQQLNGFSASYAAVITQGASTGFVPVLVAYLMGLLGVFAFGHEYRHGMIRATLTAVPRRGHVMVAKLLVVVAWAAVVAVAALLLGALAGQVMLGQYGFSLTAPDVPRVLLGYLIYVVLFTIVGLAIAVLIRHQAGALGLLFLLPLVIETVLRLVITLPPAFNSIEGVVRYFPFGAGERMLVLFPVDANPPIGPPPLSALPGGITFAIFTALLLAVGTVLFFRRDA